jgi:sulfite oxidase
MATMSALLGFYVLYEARSSYFKKELLSCEARKELPSKTTENTFTRAQVAQHDSINKGIWVTYGDNVYDITEFVQIHPGGERILLAAGKAIDPFWSVFVIHQTAETKELLESYRIGKLLPPEKDPSYEKFKASDPGLAQLFENDPERHPSLKVRSERPCNAEASPESLEPFITPNPLFYVRNHLPVPKIDPESFILEIDGPGIPIHYRLSLEELKTKFDKVDVMATIQCAGNRRNEMHQEKPVKGLLWSLGAIGNAVWSGKSCKRLFLSSSRI